MAKKVSSEKMKNFFGVDFHVHTPASSCYKGEKTDDEYINILRLYKEKDIRIVAITDHNTINGYKKFEQIKQNLIQKLNILKPLADKHPQLSLEVEATQQQLQLFSDILIVPGVEIEVNPGIHILLIFNNKTDLKIIDDFLISAGYTDDIQGKEDVIGISNFDVVDAIDKASEIGAIVIAAHADSSKGIYNELSGKYRAAVLRSKNLNGICYNNPKTKEKIITLLNNKEYKRSEPVAFIQASDFHGGCDEAGKNITYIKLEDISFEQLLLALKNPNECISPTEHPDIINIINQVLLDSKTFSYESFKNEIDKKNIVNITCAILNCGYGTLVVGVDESKKNIIGINRQEGEEIPIIKDIIDSVRPEFPAYEISVDVYPYGGKEVFAIKLANKGFGIFNDKDDTIMHIVDNGNIITATPAILSKTIENKIFDKFSEYQEKLNKKVNLLISEASLLTNTVDQFRTLISIEKCSIKLNQLFSIKVVPPTKKNYDIQFRNGESTGNVVFITKIEPRLPSANLRCSAQKTTKIDIDECNPYLFENTSLIIAPGGGSFIMEATQKWGIINLDKTHPSILLFQIQEKDSNIYKVVLGWLKSSLFIWYLNTLYGDINLHLPNIFKNAIIPLSELVKQQTQIVQVIDAIIDCENKFLDDVNQTDDIEITNEQVTIFNRKMDYYYNQIDEIIYKIFNLTETQINIISKLFEIKNIHISKRSTTST